MKIIVTPQDAYELDTLIELSKQFEHDLCVGPAPSYNTIAWDDLTRDEAFHVIHLLEMFGIEFTTEMFVKP